MVFPITLLLTVATNETPPTTESSYQPLTQSRPEPFSMMDGREEAEHEFMGCAGLDELMEIRYEILRKRMRYAVHRCCFFVMFRAWGLVCGLWRRIEMWATKTRRCLCVWLDGESLVLRHSQGVWELRRVVKSVAERRFGGWEEYVEWLGRKCRMKDVKGTNA